MGKRTIFTAARFTLPRPKKMLQRITNAAADVLTVAEAAIGQLPRKAVLAFEFSGFLLTLAANYGSILQFCSGVITIVVGIFAIRSYRSKKRADDAAAERALIEIEIKRYELRRLQSENPAV